MNRSLQTWSPFNDLWDLQDDVNSLFNRFGFGRRGQSKSGDENVMWYPSVDICENKESIKVNADLAGLEKKDIKINVEDGVLTIRGERTFNKEDQKEDYHRVERSYGTFARSFTLPTSVDQDKINATMNNGLLEILIPKKEEAKPKEIEIKVS